MEITARAAQELSEHEGAVCEAYKDSVGVWTFGIGMTNASGHTVYPRYKDNPQTMERVLELYIWLLETNYAPAVRSTFASHPLNEHQFAGALSFHYNTGAISRASWVDLFKAGQMAESEASFMQWNKPPEIVSRRRKEADLLYRGRWSQTGVLNEWGVSKPSYQPNWSDVTPHRTLPIFEGLLSGEAPPPEPPTEPEPEPAGPYPDQVMDYFRETGCQRIAERRGDYSLVYFRPEGMP